MLRVACVISSAVTAVCFNAISNNNNNRTEQSLLTSGAAYYDSTYSYSNWLISRRLAGEKLGFQQCTDSVLLANAKSRIIFVSFRSLFLLSHQSISLTTTTNRQWQLHCRSFPFPMQSASVPPPRRSSFSYCRRPCSMYSRYPLLVDPSIHPTVRRTPRL